MIAVIQRVKSASVIADGEKTGEIGQGLFILLGVLDGDGEEDVTLLSSKIAKLRIFSDEAGKMNLSLPSVGGGALVVSNFTLAANYRAGNRPDFLAAAAPAEAKALYLLFLERLSALLEKEVAAGLFGADMEISSVADGPVTIVMDSEVLKRGKRS